MRFIKKISCSLAVFCVIFSLNANLDRIAGTYNCFSPPDAELFSPIHGAIAWETRTIRHIYDFGPLFDVEQAKETFLGQQKQPEAPEEQKDPAAKHPEPQPQDMQKFLHKQLEAKLKGAPAVVQLVHLIFHRQILDSLNPADFVVTKKLQELDPRIIALLVGNILVNLKKLDLDQKTILIKAPAAEERKQVPLITLKNFLQELKQPIPPDIKNEDIPKKISELLTQKFKDDVKSKDFDIDKSQSQLIKGLFTTSIRAFLFPRELFPAETVRLVLLALLYQTSHLAPDVLATYYQTLERLDKVQIKKQEKDNFTAQDLPVFTENIKKIDSTESLRQQYEQLVYVLLYPHFQVAPYVTANLLKQDGSPTGLTFPDCMDNAFKNLFNLLAFDGNHLLTLATLQKISPDLNLNLNLNPNLNLKAFYTNPISLTEIALPNYHDQWTRVISNLPYVSYVDKSDTKDKKYWPGYIKIPSTDFTDGNSALHTFLTQNNYAIIPFKQGEEEAVITYEIQPSLRNFIIVLDTLLNLKIFQAPLATEFAKSDFVATYLPIVLGKIGQKNVTYLDEKNAAIDLKNIDVLDLKGKRITITTEMFSISVSSSHGEFNIPYKDQKIVFPNIDINSPILPFSSILLPQDVDFIVQIQDPPNRYLALFSLPLENPDFITDIPAEILTDKPILDLFLHLANRHPDPNQRQVSVCRIYFQCIFFQKVDTLSLNFTDQAIDAASQALQSQDYAVQQAGLRLFAALLTKDKGFDQAITAASQALQSQEYKAREAGVMLFEALFEKNKGFDQAITAASQALQSQNDPIKITGLVLFEKLVKKDKGFDQAITAASQALQSQNWLIKKQGLSLFEELVKKGKGFNQARKAADQALQSHDLSLQGKGKWLMNQIVDAEAVKKTEQAKQAQ